MIIETGYLNSVSLHPDGRITMQRSDLRSGTFLHIDFTEVELAAIEKALVARGLTAGQEQDRLGAETRPLPPNRRKSRSRT